MWMVDIPSTAKSHELVSISDAPGEERGQPLHQLLGGEAKDGTVGQDTNKYHPAHHIKPHTYVSSPAGAGRH